MGDLRDQIGDGRTALELLASRIPGYQGYQDREMRRDADRLLRDHLAALLSEARQRLTRYQAQLSSDKQFKPATDLSRVNRRLVRVLDRIKHSGYGYAGFFDPVKIEAAQLDQLYLYDVGLEEHVRRVGEAGTALAAATTAEERVALIATLADEMDELDRMVDARAEAAAGLTP